MKKPLISIVIPAKDCADDIRMCLDSIRSQGYRHCEIIVVDGYSNDATANIAKKLADRVISSKDTVPGCRNAGFSCARGDILLSIDSDMVMQEGLLSDIAHKFRPGVPGALVIPEYGRGKGLLSRCKSLEKKCSLKDSDVESARAFLRPVFMEIGGYDPLLLYGEDRDFHCRVAQSFCIGRADRALFHDTSRLSIVKDVRKAYSYGRSSRLFFAKKHIGGAGFFSRNCLFFIRHSRILAREPLEALCLLALRGIESAAFFLGYLSSGLRGVKR